MRSIEPMLQTHKYAKCDNFFSHMARVHVFSFYMCFGIVVYLIMLFFLLFFQYQKCYD